ncbi:cytochrome C, partial [bacterium]|nr:cytochrome C [bacterium]
MYTKLKRLLPTLLTAGVMAVVALLAGTGTVPEASALTQTDCRACHTGGTYVSMAEQHHAVAAAKGISCYTAGCHNLISNGSGGFTIQIVTDCIVCHGQVDHAAAHNMVSAAVDCGQCHNLGVVNEHITRTSTCATCHSSTKTEVQQTIAAGRAGTAVNCNNCHISVNHIAQHDKAVPSAECVTCHAQGVVYEHLNRTSTCATCHQSTNQAVIQAIAAGRAGTTVNCVSCHGALNHIQQHNMVSTPVDCSSCHNQGVVYEHTNRTSTCATCHSSTNLTVQQTITLGKNNTPVSCANCHGTPNHLAQH